MNCHRTNASVNTSKAGHYKQGGCCCNVSWVGNPGQESCISVTTSKISVSSQATILQQSVSEQLSWKKIKMANYGTTESVLTEWFQ
jgi:hypothetical protein